MKKFLIAIAITFLTIGCCREATEFQTQKWERKHKFESPRGFWGLHITLPHNKLTFKYK